MFCGQGVYDNGGKGSPLVILEIINDILKKAIDGLNKLKGTYEDDKTFVAKIEIEINLLSRLLNKHNEKEKII